MTANTTKDGGWGRFATTAINSNSEADSFGANIINCATKRWYVAMRFIPVTNPPTDSSFFLGFINNGNNRTIGAGYFGALNATNYVVQYDGNDTGSVLDLGVAKDNATIHVVEFYCQGDSKIRARIDQGAEVSATMASAPADSIHPQGQFRSGATNAVTSIDVDYALYMYPRT